MLGRGSRAVLATVAAAQRSRSQAPMRSRAGMPVGLAGSSSTGPDRLARRRRPGPSSSTLTTSSIGIGSARAFSSNPAHFPYQELPAAGLDPQQQQHQQQPTPAQQSETAMRWLQRKALECLLQFQEEAAHGRELDERAVGTLRALARLNAEAGHPLLAVDLLERALAIQIEAQGGAEDHPEAIAVMQELTALYGGALGQPVPAMRMGERLLVATRRLAEAQDGGGGPETAAAVALAMRDVGRLKGFCRDHAGKQALLERALEMQRRRAYAGELGGSEHHVEVLRTRLYLAAAQVAAAPPPPGPFAGPVDPASLAPVEEAAATVDLLLEIQQARAGTPGEVALSLALLHAKALLEGEMGRGKEKAELLGELLALRQRFDGPSTATHEALDIALDLAAALGPQRDKRLEARALLEGTAVRLQESLVFTPAQAIDVAVRSALAWGALGELGTRVRMLERAHDCQEIFLAGDVSEALVTTKLELAEAVRLMGDRQRADALVASAEEARAQLEAQVGFPVRDDPRRLRLAVMLEALGDHYF